MDKSWDAEIGFFVCPDIIASAVDNLLRKQVDRERSNINVIQPRNMSIRTEKYSLISNTLACKSTKQLLDALRAGKEMHTGIGGHSVHIEIEGHPVFVKQVPITDLELHPEHLMSTSNIFNLPMSYQYGIGSAGFSVWRELAAHIMTTNWVISGQCPYFPMMYHWRIIPESSKTSHWESTEKYMDYWENNESIAKRVNQLRTANSSVLLFLEHFPKNLYQYLKEVISNYSEEDSVHYLKKLNKTFDTVFKWLQSQDFLHMDAHFHNILADEENIYFSDFGLALSAQFDLSTTEKIFIKTHKNYDRCSFSVNLLHAVLTSYLGKDDWDNTFNDFLAYRLSVSLSDEMNHILSKHASIAEIMYQFYKQIQKDKSTQYPFDQLNHLLDLSK
jgi:hypothetical protein